MDKLYDFTYCKPSYRDYGGSDRKFGIVFNNDNYMIKFSEKHEKKDDFTTSYLNKPTSEYISSHISNIVGIPAHSTLLGEYNGEVCVACKDFRDDVDNNLNFRNIMQSIYDAGEITKIPKLQQVYDTIEKSNLIPVHLKQPSIERFWDTFIIDALVGNFDRHIENWGYIANSKTGIRLAPAYDFGSTLLPQLADEGMVELCKDEFKLLERCFVFPSPALHISFEKKGKVGYYDLLSSNYDENCTDAVLRIVPKIDMEKIYKIIDETPIVSDIKKDFYKFMLTLRKEILLDSAFEKCQNKEYDTEAYARIKNGIQFSDELLKEKINKGELKVDWTILDRWKTHFLEWKTSDKKIENDKKTDEDGEDEISNNFQPIVSMETSEDMKNDIPIVSIIKTTTKLNENIDSINNGEQGNQEVDLLER